MRGEGSMAESSWTLDENNGKSSLDRESEAVPAGNGSKDRRDNIRRGNQQETCDNHSQRRVVEASLWAETLKLNASFVHAYLRLSERAVEKR